MTSHDIRRHRIEHQTALCRSSSATTRLPGLIAAGVLSIGALAGCAASYERDPGSDAALVRVSSRDVMNAMPRFTPVAEGRRCGKAFTSPMLLAYTGPSQFTASLTVQQQNQAARRDMPREAMLDSPAKEVTNVAELRIRPGQWQVLVAGGEGYSSCAPSFEARFEPGRQYWVDMNVDRAQKKCFLTFSRVEKQGDKDGWVRQPVTPAGPCM